MDIFICPIILDNYETIFFILYFILFKLSSFVFSNSLNSLSVPFFETPKNLRKTKKPQYKLRRFNQKIDDKTTLFLYELYVFFQTCSTFSFQVYQELFFYFLLKNNGSHQELHFFYMFDTLNELLLLALLP